MRLLLVNPNTNAATTEAMLSIAREVAPDGITVEGATALFGESLITDVKALAIAAEAVEALLTPPRVAGIDGSSLRPSAIQASLAFEERCQCP
jgi:allantoin racemase